MKHKRILTAGSTIAALALAAVATPVIANHAWSTYHWSTPDGVVRVPVVDTTSGTWPARVKLASDDWNRSANIQSAYTRGTANQKRCPQVSGTIQVCATAYGRTGWLGIASITLSGGHIASGTTKLNDTYFTQAQYNTESWKQLVTCQEIGHDYGLGHQDEDFNTDTTNSCMDYTSQPAGNEHPDQHDYDQLALIYAHLDGAAAAATSTANKGKPLGIDTGDSPAEWGRVVGRDAAGRPNEYVRNVNGYTVITHVTWAPDAKVPPGRLD